MKRSDFPQGLDTMRIDINSEAAYAALGMQSRLYPRLMPVPFHTIAETDELILPAWRKNLEIYPQLYFIVGETRRANAKGVSKSFIRGIGFGIGLVDDGILQASRDPSPRDECMCRWYSLYSDDSQVFTQEIFSNVCISDVVLTMESPTMGKTVFPQRDLLFSPGKLAEEAGILIEFRKDDLISLGAAARPVSVKQDCFFRKGEAITVTAEGISQKPVVFQIRVRDDRDPECLIPSWKPRDFLIHG